MNPGFPHESLVCYQLALGIARWVLAARFPPAVADLSDQARRAAVSMTLNIAEGTRRGGGAGRNHFRVAFGSAAELCAALDLMDLPGATERQAELRRVGAMLRKLSG